MGAQIPGSSFGPARARARCFVSGRMKTPGLESANSFGKGYLVAILDRQRKVSGYRLSKTWPPPPSFFESGPIGFVYFGPRWFQFYVIEYMEKVMAQIETKEGMLQLNHLGHSGPEAVVGRISASPSDFQHSSDAIPHTYGNFVDQNGRTWSADTDLMA